MSWSDPPPHVFEDRIGLQLAAPDDGWQNRPDMSPFTKPFRASIVARARFIEDLVTEQVSRGVEQYAFDASRPAIVASTVAATLRQVAALASGSTFVMSFLLPIEMADTDVRRGLERAIEGARRSGTPFVSFFTPDEMLSLARDADFRDVLHVSSEALGERYFSGRTDGLRPPRNSEELLIATTQYSQERNAVMRESTDNLRLSIP